MNSRHRFADAAGWILTIGSLLGVCCAVVIIGWPKEVPITRYSYPFDSGSFVAVQIVLAIRHLTEMVGVLGLIAFLWRMGGLLLRIGLVSSLLGTVLLAAMELIAITAGGSAADSPVASAVNTGYAVPTLAIGGGFVLAGTTIFRRRALPGGIGRWIVLVCGIYVFVPLIPALVVGDVVARIAIGLWSLLIAGIGLALIRAAAEPHRSAEPAMA